MICLFPQFYLPHTQDHKAHSFLVLYTIPGHNAEVCRAWHKPEAPSLLLKSLRPWLQSTTFASPLHLTAMLTGSALAAEAVLLHVFALPKQTGENGCSCVNCFPQWLQSHTHQRVTGSFLCILSTWHWGFLLYSFCDTRSGVTGGQDYKGLGDAHRKKLLTQKKKNLWTDYRLSSQIAKPLRLTAKKWTH